MCLSHVSKGQANQVEMLVGMLLSLEGVVNSDRTAKVKQCYHMLYCLSLDPMYLKMQQNLVEKHEAEKEGELESYSPLSS